jgi:F-type H+-transporting ATPase subunit delta
MASAQQGRDPGVAKVYAKAMLSLAEAEGQAEELLEELAELGRALDADPELAAFLASPLVGEQARAEVLETIFRGRASDLLVDALEVINHKGRLWLLRAIVDAFRGEYRELRGVVDARVTTAVPLDAAQRSDLLAALARFTGKRPELLERVDPAILGGLVVEVAGEKIDSSLAARLHDVGVALAGRAALELHHGGSLAAAVEETPPAGSAA